LCFRAEDGIRGFHVTGVQTCALPISGKGASALLDELGLELHGAEAFDLAVDVVVAVDQADVLDLGADLDDGGRAFELEVLDQGEIGRASCSERVLMAVGGASAEDQTM